MVWGLLMLILRVLLALTGAAVVVGAVLTGGVTAATFAVVTVEAD